ncbi:MAG: hypothetical protein NE334_14155 [Lentisphaeraceae bacterium]|nr:hypothetical protein [Lentisphaeraceae bacterium]
MSYKFLTPCCDHKLRVDNKLEGRKLECPFCTSPFYIPTNTHKIRRIKWTIVAFLAVGSLAAIIFLTSTKMKDFDTARDLQLQATKEQALWISTTAGKDINPMSTNHAQVAYLTAELLMKEHDYTAASQNFKKSIQSYRDAQQQLKFLNSKIIPDLQKLKDIIRSHRLRTPLTKVAYIEALIDSFMLKKAETALKELKNTLPKSKKTYAKKSTKKTTKKTPIKTSTQTKTTKSKPKETVVSKLSPVSSKKEIPEVEILSQEAKEPEEIFEELTFENNEAYSGHMLNKKFHGQGQYTYSNNNNYNGSWQEGQWHGKGKYSFYFGDTFEGEWQDGQRHGIGIYTWKNGNKLKALWQEGLIEGNAYFYPKGKPKIKLSYSRGRVTSSNTTYEYSPANSAIISKFTKKSLNKKQSRIYLFTKKISDARTKLQLENEKLIMPDLPPQKALHERYFKAYMSDKDMSKTETQLKDEFFVLKRYCLISNNPETENDDVTAIVGNIDGYSISAAKLGVVLDNSGSMLKYIEPLKKKISENFPNAAFIEVGSCRLTTFKTTKVSEKAADDNTMNAFKYLIETQGVDSIYWFSDLNGTRAPTALKELQKWFDSSLVSLYVSSVGNKPDKELLKLIENSGGEYIKK